MYGLKTIEVGILILKVGIFNYLKSILSSGTHQNQTRTTSAGIDVSVKVPSIIAGGKLIAPAILEINAHILQDKEF